MLTLTFLGVGSAFAKRNFNSNCLFEFWEKPWQGDIPSKPPDDTLLDWSGFKTDWSSMERKHVRLVFDYISAAHQPLRDFDAYAAEFSSRMIAASIAGCRAIFAC